MAWYTCSAAVPSLQATAASGCPAPPEAGPSDSLVHIIILFIFACGVLFSVLLLHSSFRVAKLFRALFVPLFGSSDFSVPTWFLFAVLVSALHTSGHDFPNRSFILFSK